MFDQEFDNEEFEMSDNLSAEERIKATEIYNKLIDKLVRDNYASIEENGIDVVKSKLHVLNDGSIKQLKDTLDFMIQYFVESEEYEKCAVLNKYIEMIP
jgi:predicted house-cleaning noncanonical NTP pyrophosphatase (MazG superfamily)